MRDYDGPMEYFIEQLHNAGVYEDEFDIRDWVGCTKDELQGLVDLHIRKHNAKEGK